VTTLAPTPRVRTRSGLFILVVVIILIVVVIGGASSFVIGWRFCGKYLTPVIKTAVTPVPGPAEIRDRLQAEWSRPVSLSEALEVHAYLCRERNAAAFTTLIAAGGIAYLDHSLHG
jgi:hypothetical protein